MEKMVKKCAKPLTNKPLTNYPLTNKPLTNKAPFSCKAAPLVEEVYQHSTSCIGNFSPLFIPEA